jgi:hypothetical protein
VRRGGVRNIGCRRFILQPYRLIRSPIPSLLTDMAAWSFMVSAMADSSCVSVARAAVRTLPVTLPEYVSCTTYTRTGETRHREPEPGEGKGGEGEGGKGGQRSRASVTFTFFLCLDGENFATINGSTVDGSDLPVPLSSPLTRLRKDYEELKFQQQFCVLFAAH